MKFPPPATLGTAAKTADELIAKARQVFPGSYELLEPGPCSYDAHRGCEWRAGGSDWRCGVCHPPTASVVEWNR